MTKIADLGKIIPPPVLEPFTGNKTGTQGFSLFLSNLIELIYALAGIVLVFMLVWGAWEWLVSGGDKEKIAAARSRIIHAIIGLMLFAIAFAVIGALGTFTGFKFFEG